MNISNSTPVKKILFITSSVEDYLADGLLHGLRHLLGANVVDFPKADHLYSCFQHKVSHRIRGHGMTLYTDPLPDIPIDRAQIEVRLVAKEFDWIVFSAIDRQYGQFVQWLDYLSPANTVLLDGSDSDFLYPYLKSPFSLRSMHQKWSASDFLYYKREWTARSRYGLLPRIARQIGIPSTHSSKNLRRISFSIPKSKMVSMPPEKIKMFPEHIVDDELRNLLATGKLNYAFNNEADYYRDLRASKFGVTMKRGGWDCLRHYEIVANHAVPCFRDLNRKEPTCAPHGLDASNCLIYDSAGELLERCRTMGEEEYSRLQSAGQTWLRGQTTVQRATDLLTSINYWQQA
jgi:hypothetical protein